MLRSQALSRRARLWAEALSTDPKLGDDREASHRYSAACSAALAAAGQGEDDPPPDQPARAKLRAQALEWLKAELTVWRKVLETGPAQARPTVVQTLQNWKQDTDLAGIRNEKELAQLNEPERKQCQTLWAELEAVLKRAQGPKP